MDGKVEGRIISKWNVENINQTQAIDSDADMDTPQQGWIDSSSDPEKQVISWKKWGKNGNEKKWKTVKDVEGYLLSCFTQDEMMN